MSQHSPTGLPWSLRAVQLDLARQMETVDTICRYADFAATSGFNTLVLYLEGRVRTAAFPYRRAEESYTLDDMARVVARARDVGVAVVPALATLGHAEQFFACPEMAALAEERDGRTRFGGTAKHTFCPSLPETYAFLRAYLTELATVFPAPHMHVGCDEAWNLGYCDLCRETALGALFTGHLEKVSGICADLGKRMWIWDDLYEIFPDEVARAPRGTVMCHWHYESVIEPEGGKAHFFNLWRKDWLAEYARLGIDAVICPWNNSRNIATFTDYGRRHPVLGGLLTQWEMSARFHEEYAPTVAFAGQLWQQQTFDPEAAWTAALPTVAPKASAPLAAAVRTLTTLTRRFPSTRVAGYLTGPLTNGEVQRETALRAALALLECSRGNHVSPLLDDLALTARLELLTLRLRALLPRIYDPRCPAADTAWLHAEADACCRELAAIQAQYAPLHAARRPGMYPEEGGSRHLRAVEEGLQPAWDRLARATADDDWWLLLRLFLPDAYGAPRLTVTLVGDEERVLFSGSAKPELEFEQCYYTLQLPFTAATPPARIRLEAGGYGGQGVAFLEAQSRSATYYPRALHAVSGPVAQAEALLTDDSGWAYLGQRDIAAAFHTPTEICGVVEVEMG